MYKNIVYGIFLTLLVVGFSFLYIFFRHIPPNLKGVLFSLNKKHLFFSFLSLFSYHTFDNLRVFLISKTLGLRYSFWYGYQVSLVSTFGATITPAHLGGEFLPFYTLRRVGGEIPKIMSIITLKGFSGLVFYLLFFPFMIHNLLNHPEEGLQLLLIVGVIFLIGGLGYVIVKVLFKKRHRIVSESLWFKIKFNFFKYLLTCKFFVKENKKVLFLAILFSLLMYLSFLMVGIFLVKAFNQKVCLLEVFFNQLPLLYAIFISPTPGGSGVGELGAIVIFKDFLDASALGIFAMLLRIISQYLSAVIGGIIFFIMGAKDLLWKSNNEK
ncbi:flippase-like domain-containing protein [Thermodesulfobacterium sp. TA1]|uniref:flippase-like domain-containing protein n=1 Tax=Thermodesulfobacterium sp. TA1 TaxID=2234087 RepID=UPI001231CA29|nr:flippase-like domain-containing protein [Thermodesulfobacterium sp. TA1]QER41744.1 flippase-like domain-containing protein [Thermodesulfobacterium sp. TA1]